MRVLWHTHIHIHISDVEAQRLCPTPHNIHTCTAAYPYSDSHSYQWYTGELAVPDATQYTCVYYDTHTLTLKSVMQRGTAYAQRHTIHMHILRHTHLGWLRVVGSLKSWVSFAKEPYKRDYILRKRPMILRSLLLVATPYRDSHSYHIHISDIQASWLCPSPYTIHLYTVTHTHSHSY